MRRVDVIVVTYRSAALLPACIGGVRQAAEVSRVIVVDNASDDDSASQARRCDADVVVENDRNLGFARAVNAGLRSADQDLVLLLNPDAVVSDAALGTLCEDFERDAGVAIAGPLLVGDDGTLTAGAGPSYGVARRVGHCLPVIGRARGLRAAYRLPDDGRRLARPVDVGYVYGAAMLADRRFLHSCGGLDERYFLFSEDEDVCRQARHAGRRVLLDGRARVRHAGGASCLDEPLTEAQRLFSIWRFYEKWDGRLAAATYHRGTLLAFRARAAATALDGAARRAIERTARLFDEAVRSGVDPLVARAQEPSALAGTDTPAAPAGTGT